jgi:hypothetical protein
VAVGAVTDCPRCGGLRDIARRARGLRLKAEEDYLAAHRALADHEAEAHPVAAPAPWAPDPPRAVVGQDSTGVTYTFDPRPDQEQS